MKVYHVIIENSNEIVSDFKVEAKNLSEARQKALFNKRMTGLKGKTSVRLNK